MGEHVEGDIDNGRASGFIEGRYWQVESRRDVVLASGDLVYQ